MKYIMDCLRGCTEVGSLVVIFTDTVYNRLVRLRSGIAEGSFSQ